MKITRYFQSCLLIEEGGVRILIDASADEASRFDEFGKLDALLYTHEHADHFDAELAQKFAATGVSVYANASTAKQMKSQPILVTDGQEFDIAGLKIKAIELPHCLMADGGKGPQNTGYLIGGNLFNPGDGKELAGLSVDNLVLPITGPDISIKEALDLVKQLGGKMAIPVHYDFIGTKPEVVAIFIERYNLPIELRILQLGQSTEI